VNFELTQIIKFLVLPPGGLILLGFLGLLLSQKFLGKVLVFLALLGFYLMNLPMVSNMLVKGLEIYPAITIEAAKKSKAEVIVVLGAGRHMNAAEYGADTIGNLHLERVRYAAWLSHRVGIPVIPSGGRPSKKGLSEAELAQIVLEEEFGARVAAIEDLSNNTRENIQQTKMLLKRMGIKRFLLVTHAWHMPRAMAVVRQAGIDAIPAPTAFHHRDYGGYRISDWLPNPKSGLYSYYALHEYLGRLWYWITSH